MARSPEKTCQTHRWLMVSIVRDGWCHCHQTTYTTTTPVLVRVCVRVCSEADVSVSSRSRSRQGSQCAERCIKPRPFGIIMDASMPTHRAAQISFHTASFRSSFGWGRLEKLARNPSGQSTAIFQHGRDQLCLRIIARVPSITSDKPTSTTIHRSRRLCHPDQLPPTRMQTIFS